MINLIILVLLLTIILQVVAQLPIKDSLKQCENNQYYDFIDSSCQKCQDNCVKCLGQDCLMCEYGTLETNQKCLSQSESCKLGQFLEEKTKVCKQCIIPFCSSCSALSICLQCENNFILTPDFRCILQKFMSNEDDDGQRENNSSLKMSISDQGMIDFTYSCPLLSYENPSTRICESMMQIPDLNTNEKEYISGDIIQIEQYKDNNQILVISSSSVFLVNRENLKMIKKIFQISITTQSDHHDNNDETIQHGLLFENILKLFTQNKIYIIDLNVYQCIQILNFEQGVYIYQLKKRYQINTTPNEFTYLYVSKDKEKLYTSVFDITIVRENGVIVVFSLDLKKTIYLNIEEKKFLAISYMKEQQNVFISVQQKVYIVFLDKALAEYNADSSDVNVNDFSKYYSSTFFDQPSTYILDICEINSDGVIYLLRVLKQSMSLSKIEVLEKVQIKVTYSSTILEQSLRYVLKGQIQNENVNDANSKLMLTLLYSSIQADSSPTNMRIYVCDIEYYFSTSNNYQQFIFPLLNTYGIDLTTSQFLLFTNPINRYRYLLTFSSSRIIILLMDFTQQLITQTYFYTQNIIYSVDLTNLCILQGDYTVYDIEVILPIKSIILSYRLKDQVMSSLYSQDNLFSTKNELFYVPISDPTYIGMDMQVIYDEDYQIISFIETNIQVKSYFIYQYDLQNNSFIAFRIIPMTQYFEWGTKNVSILYRAVGQYLYLIKPFNMHCIEYYSLRVTYYVEFESLVVAQSNYIFISTGNQNQSSQYEHLLIRLSPNGIIQDSDRLVYYWSFIINNQQAVISLFSYGMQSCIVLQLPIQSSSKLKQFAIIKDLNELYRLQVGQIRYIDFLSDKEFVVMQDMTATLRLKLTRYRITFDSQSIKVDVVQEYNFTSDLLHQQYDKYIKIQRFLNDQLKIMVSYIQYTTTALFTTIEVYDLNAMKTIAYLQPLENSYSSNYKINLLTYQYDNKNNQIQFFYQIYDATFGYYLYSKTLLFSYDSDNKTFITKGIAFSSNSDPASYNNQMNGRIIIILSEVNPTLSSSFLNYFVSISFIQPFSYYVFFPKVMYESNQILMRYGSTSFLIQNIPSYQTLKQIPYSYEIPLSSWFLSEELNILITFRKYLKTGSQTEKIMRIEFQTLDYFEYIYNDIESDERSQIFWFEKYKMLVICAGQSIQSYKIVSGELNEYQSQIQDQNIDFSTYTYRCIQSILNPYLFCQSFGIFNIITSQLLTDSTLDIINNPSIEENNSYIIFGNKKLFYIELNTVEDIKAQFITQFSQIQLSSSVSSQGFYQDTRTDCTIFSLPNFDIIYTFTGSSIFTKGVDLCLFDKSTAIFVTYSQGTFTGNTLPLDNTSEDNNSSSFSIAINSQFYQHFSNLSQLIGHYFYGQSQVIQQSNAGIRQILIIDIYSLEINLYSLFQYKQKAPTILNYWPEKNVLFTDIGFVVLSDLSLDFDLSGRDKEHNSQRNQVFNYNKNFNYIVYESQDLLSLNILDISETVPLNKNNTSIQNSFTIINTNIYYPISTNLQQVSYEATLLFLDYNQYQIVSQTFRMSNSQNGNEQNSLIESKIIFALDNDQPLNEDLSKSPYTLIQFQAKDTIKNENNIFGLIFRCNLIIFEQDETESVIINQKSLKDSNCKVLSNMKYLSGLQRQKYSIENEQLQEKADTFFIIQNQTIITQIKVVGKQVVYIQIADLSLIQNDRIQNIYYWNQLQSNSQIAFIGVIYFKQKNVITIIQIKDDEKAQSSSLSLSQLDVINCIQFINALDKIFLIVGTQDQLQIYSVDYSGTVPLITLSAKFEMMQRGKISNVIVFYTTIGNQQVPSLVANIFVTSKYRISLFELLLIDQLQQSVQINLLKENLLHTRRRHQMLYFEDKSLLAIFSRLQIMILSSSLQLVARIESQMFLFIRNVQISQNGFHIFITDLENVFVFDLRQFIQGDNNLQLLQQFPYQLPYIHQIIEAELSINSISSEKYYILFGQHLTGLLLIKYYPQSASFSEKKMITLTKIPNEKNLQEEYYSSILSSDDFEINTTKMVYFTLQSDSPLFIPINLIGFEYQKVKKKLDIQINLNGYKGLLYHYMLDINNSFISSMIISNGTLILSQDIYLLSLTKLVFQNVALSFQTQGFKFQFINIEQIIFDEILIKNQVIKSDERMKALQEEQQRKMKVNPLILITNSTKTVINNLKIDISTIQRDIFYFVNNTDIFFYNQTIINSDIQGTFAIFTSENKNITIQHFLVSSSILLQGISIQNADRIRLENITILNSRQTIKKEGRRRNLLETSNTSATDSYVNSSYNNYLSFLKIEYILNEAIVRYINVKSKTYLYCLIDYSNSFVTLIQNNTTDNTTDNTSYQSNIQQTKQSQSSTLYMESFNISDSYFEEAALIIVENKIEIMQFKITQNINPTMNISNSIQGLQINDMEYSLNEFTSQQSMVVKNSVVIFSNMIFSQNKITTLDANEVYDSIFITNSIFSIDNLNAYNNTQSGNFIKIVGVDQSDHDYNQTIIPSNKINRLINVFISGCTNSAVRIENYQEIQIISSKFEWNSLSRQTEKGGALVLIKIQQSSLIKLIVMHNFAILSGGGIYLENSNIQLFDSEISYNEALIGGGLRYNNTSHETISYLMDKVIQRQILNNKAQIFGKNIGSFPSRIKVVSDSRGVSSSLNQMSTKIVFEIYGEDGEIAQLDVDTFIEKNYPSYVIEEVYQYQRFQLSADTLLLEGQTSQSLYNPLTKQFSMTVYIVDSGYDELLEITKNRSKEEVNQYIFNQPAKHIQLGYISWYKTDGSSIYAFSVDIHVSFRKCQEGELISKVDSNFYQCLLCQDNTYILGDPYSQIQQGQCKQCPLGSSFCQGNLILPKESYWVQPDSDYIAYCQNLPSKCTQKYSLLKNISEVLDQIEQNNSLISNGCIEGGYGPLCESCDYNGDFWSNQTAIRQFGKISDFECTECDNKTEYIEHQIFNLFLIIIFYVGFAYKIISDMTMKINLLAMHYLKKACLIRISSTLSNQGRNSSILKILISYIQIVSIIQYQPLQMSNYLRKTLFFIGDILNIGYYMLDCIFIKSKLSTMIDIVYLRLIWTLIQPILYFIITMIFVKIVIKNPILTIRRNNFLVQSLVLYYFLAFPSLINQTLGILCCQKINNKNYLILDSQFKCMTEKYVMFNITISAPLLIFTTLLPYLMYQKMKHRRNNRNEINRFVNYGILYSEYKESKFYWEIVRIYMKILMLLGLNVLKEQQQMSGVLIVLLITIYIKYQQQHLPYKQTFLNHIDQLSAITAILTICATLIYTNSQNATHQFILVTLCLIANAFFLFKIFISFQFTNSYFLKFKFFQAALNRIKNKYPYLFSANNKVYVNNIFRLTKNWNKLAIHVQSFRVFDLKPYQNFTNHAELTSQNNIFSQIFTSQQQIFNSQRDNQQNQNYNNQFSTNNFHGNNEILISSQSPRPLQREIFISESHLSINEDAIQINQNSKDQLPYQSNRTQPIRQSTFSPRRNNQQLFIKDKQNIQLNSQPLDFIQSPTIIPKSYNDQIFFSQEDLQEYLSNESHVIEEGDVKNIMIQSTQTIQQQNEINLNKNISLSKNEQIDDDDKNEDKAIDENFDEIIIHTTKSIQKQKEA